MTRLSSIQKLALLTATATAALAAAAPASALNIVLNADSSFSSQPNGTAALAAF